MELLIDVVVSIVWAITMTLCLVACYHIGKSVVKPHKHKKKTEDDSWPCDVWDDEPLPPDIEDDDTI